MPDAAPDPRRPSVRVLLVSCGALSLLAYGGLAFQATSFLNWSSELSAVEQMLTFVGFWLVATLAPLLVLVALWRSPDAAGRRDARIALGFAVAFAVVCAFSTPSEDFSYYIAEGRLAAAGGNVYTQYLSAEHIVGLQPPVSLEAQLVTWPYGPGWLWIVSSLSKLASPGMEFAWFKGVILIAFLGMVSAIFGTLRQQSPARQTAAMLIAGWLPVSVQQSVGEGHNDVVMVALLTGWLVLAMKPSSGWLLAASSLVKFVTIPLIPVAAVGALAQGSRRSLLVLAAAGATAGAVLAVYWNGGALFANVSQGRHSSMVSALDWALSRAHVPATLVEVLIGGWRAVVVLAIAGYAWRHLRAPSWPSLMRWVTVVLLGLLLVSDFLYPWYLIWMIPSLALSLEARLLSVALPLLVCLPLKYVPMTGPHRDRLDAVIYLTVFVCWIVAAGVIRHSRSAARVTDKK